MSRSLSVRRSSRARRYVCLCAVLSAATVLLVSGVAASWPGIAEQAKLTGFDGADYDYFGIPVAVSGDTIAVGAYLDDDNGNSSGSVYVFYRNLGGVGNWGHVTKLLASDGAPGDIFGVTTAIDGDTIVVGAYRDDAPDYRSGSAYVFYRNEGGADNWGQVTQLLPSDGAEEDNFGSAVAVDGDTIVVGSWWDDDEGVNSGSAYVFERNQGGPNSWGLATKLTASDGAAYDYFGAAAAIAGDTLVVGARNDDDRGSNSGSAYLFDRNQGGAGNWGEVTKLTASDGAGGDRFGVRVAIAGDTIAVGAYRDDDNGIDSGSAYVFDRNHGGVGNWGEVARLLASDGAAEDRFGLAVAVAGDTVIVGAFLADDKGVDSGAAYAFDRNQGGVGNWGQIAKLSVSDGAAGDRFGNSVAVANYTIVVGAYWDDDMGTDSGAAYVYRMNQPPVVGEITAPLDPVAVDTEIQVGAGFSDPDSLDTHTAMWEWGDDTTSEGTVDESEGLVSGTYSYSRAGVYTLRLTVTDAAGASDDAVYEYVVVYDPDGGFVTGGGWINSPAGAYTPDPSLAGKATFGFVSKYKKGASVPTGQTEFQFKVAHLNFHSNAYQWLVVAGPKGQFKGVGTINGAGNYGFMLTAVDAARTPSTDVDLFRIKIWDKDAGDAIVYDNMLGVADDADPTTAIGGGSIMVHKK